MFIKNKMFLKNQTNGKEGSLTDGCGVEYIVGAGRLSFTCECELEGNLFEILISYNTLIVIF